MLPLPRLVLKHTPVSIFIGKKLDLAAWTKDARHYAKIVGFLYVFVSDLPQYISVGDLDTENALLTDTGYSRESVYIHMHWRRTSYRRLSRARATRVSCTGEAR